MPARAQQQQQHGSTSPATTNKENAMPSSSAPSPDASSRKKKGKARAVEDDGDDATMLSEPEEQGARANGMQANGGATASDEDESSDEDDGNDEPAVVQRRLERKAEKRRRLRTKYRALQHQVDDARGDLQNTTVDALTAQVSSANTLFDRVENPSEAVLDSRVLIATSEAGALKARQLKIDKDAFDTDEFLARLAKFLGGSGGRSERGKRRQRTRGRAGSDEDELDDGDDDDVALLWARAGQVLAGESKRPAPLDFMYGPLQLEIKEKKARTQRAKNQVDEADRMRPEELHAEDVAKNENETGKVVAKIGKHLTAVGGTTGIPYLKFVVNPHSFSQTVENCFYFSFLVREQKAAIELDEDPDSEFCGDMIAFMVDPEAAAAAAGQPAAKNQVVLELTEEVWREAIELYGIDEPLIPSREAFVAPTASGKHKWAPTILDYHSDCPTFALAISPLSSSSAASLKLAVGSYSEARAPAPSIAALSATTNPTGSGGVNGAPPQGAPGGNNFTIAGLSAGAAELDDASDSESETAYVHRGTRQRVPGGGSAFVPLARAPLLYPPSAVRFAPARLSSSLAAGAPDGAEREVLATSTECLRLWDLVGEQEDGAHGRAGNGFVGSAGQPQSRSRLVSRATLQNAKADFSAPLTGFSWSELEPTKIVTSSIDTTCTVWDISTGVPVTQLIAHDREVYDVAWSPASRDIFASVGADGSVRMFDLRSLEHSTILYEAAPAGAPQRGNNSNNNGASSSPPSGGSTTPAPLLRLAFSPTAPAYVAVVHADSADVQILDTRNPGAPAFEVRGHRAPVNGLTWGGGVGNGQGGETSGPGWLATVGDDANLLLWDLSNAQPPQPPSRSVPQQPKPISHPTLAYTAPSEVNAVAWGGGGDWVTIGCGRTVRTIRV
ncbi:hypothetical protein JCM10449v2_005678 [Rhodotorula kratochvilovae]